MIQQFFVRWPGRWCSPAAASWDSLPKRLIRPLHRHRSSSATNVLTLEGAIRLALENNPELRASSGRIDAATGRAYQAKLWTNPELTLSAEDWPVSGGGGFSDSKQTMGVAQTIPFPGKKKLDRQIGVSGVRLSEAELSLRRLELVRDVKIAFYQVLAAERWWKWRASW